MAYTSVNPADVAARKPVTDILMNVIRTDLDDLNARLIAIGFGGHYDWRFNGRLDLLPTYPTAAAQGVPQKVARRIDNILISNPGTYQDAKVLLENPGTGGPLEIDIRKYVQVSEPIQSIQRIFDDTINSITEVTATATQSITRATAQVNTQSITYFKAAINILSIVPNTRAGEMRVNLASAFDAEAVVGDSYTVLSATTPANNGTFVVLRIGDDGENNVVLSNGSAVAQANAVGTAQLAAFSYNLAASANINFQHGENVILAAHTTGANNGLLPIYAVNSGGNNIIVKNATGATQGGIAGTVDCSRLSFNFAAPATSEFGVGIYIVCSGHSSGSNNGTFITRGYNAFGGQGLLVSVASIVLQGSPAGTCKSMLKLVNLNIDPLGLIAQGDTIVISGSDNSTFNGTYPAEYVKFGGTFNVAVRINTAGTAGAAGNFFSGQVKVNFSSDQSAQITTDSKIEINGCAYDGLNGVRGNNGYFPVKTVNSGGFNVVIDNADNQNQVGPQGRVDVESKSIFSSRPILNYAANGWGFSTVNNGVFNSLAACAEGDKLGIEVLQIPTGKPSGLLVRIR